VVASGWWDCGEGVRGRVVLMTFCGGWGWRGTYGLGKREKGVGRGTRRGMEKGEWCAGEGVRGEVVEVKDGVGEEVSGGVEADVGKGRGGGGEVGSFSVYTP
jgi:hypothetical protein